MNKYIFTFGSAHLEGLGINPQQQILVIEAENENVARDIVLKSFIGPRFAFSYDYAMAKELIDKYNMCEITLEELEALRHRSKQDSNKALKEWVTTTDNDVLEALGYAIMSDGQFAEQGKKIAKDSFSAFLEE